MGAESRVERPVKTNVVVWCGDSITKGNHVGAGEDFPSLVAASITAIAANDQNIAVPSSTINSGQGTAADGYYDGTKQANVCCVMWGINDLAGGATAATTKASLKTFCQARQSAGFSVLLMTLLPCNTFTDANSLREAANVLIRADSSFYSVLVDLGDTGTTMGNVSALSDTAKYSDGVHPTYAGNQLLEPAITAGLTTLLSDGRFSSVFSGVLR